MSDGALAVGARCVAALRQLTRLPGPLHALLHCLPAAIRFSSQPWPSADAISE